MDSTDENKPSIQELEKISQKYGLESPKIIDESEIFILAEKDKFHLAVDSTFLSLMAMLKPFSITKKAYFLKR